MYNALILDALALNVADGSRGRANPWNYSSSSSSVLDPQLVERAKAERVTLTGRGGLLGDLTKRVLEAGLEGEMDSHVGHGKHAVEGRNGGNSRNGTRTKTVITDIGPIEVNVPRDRDGTFEPQIVRKHQRRRRGSTTGPR